MSRDIGDESRGAFRRQRWRTRVVRWYKTLANSHGADGRSDQMGDKQNHVCERLSAQVLFLIQTIIFTAFRGLAFCHLSMANLSFLNDMRS